MRTHKLLITAILFTLAGFAPLISVLLAAGVAALFHCKVGNGQALPCLVAGLDITPGLVRMGMFGWWEIVAWILLIPASLLWAIWAVRWFLRRFRAVMTGAPDPQEKH